MWELVKAGGWLMLPLIFCSIFTVAITIERFLRLRRSSILPKALLCTNSHTVKQVAQTLYAQPLLQHSALGQILKAGLDNQNMGEKFAKAQMEVTASQEIGTLERHINFLGTISAVAPLLGLLGTVVGIIESFLMIDLASNSNPTLMIPGISKALITTAVGMLIAIPALVAYRYFQRVVHEYIAEFEQQAKLFHAALFFQPEPNSLFQATQSKQNMLNQGSGYEV